MTDRGILENFINVGTHWINLERLDFVDWNGRSAVVLLYVGGRPEPIEVPSDEFSALLELWRMPRPSQSGAPPPPVRRRRQLQVLSNEEDA